MCRIQNNHWLPAFEGKTRLETENKKKSSFASESSFASDSNHHLTQMSHPPDSQVPKRVSIVPSVKKSGSLSEVHIKLSLDPNGSIELTLDAQNEIELLLLLLPLSASVAGVWPNWDTSRPGALLGRIVNSENMSSRISPDAVIRLPTTLVVLPPKHLLIAFDSGEKPSSNLSALLSSFSGLCEGTPWSGSRSLEKAAVWMSENYQIGCHVIIVGAQKGGSTARVFCDLLCTAGVPLEPKRAPSVVKKFLRLRAAGKVIKHVFSGCTLQGLTVDGLFVFDAASPDKTPPKVLREQLNPTLLVARQVVALDDGSHYSLPMQPSQYTDVVSSLWRGSHRSVANSLLTLAYMVRELSQAVAAGHGFIPPVFTTASAAEGLQVTYKGLLPSLESPDSIIASIPWHGMLVAELDSVHDAMVAVHNAPTVSSLALKASTPPPKHQKTLRIPDKSHQLSSSAAYGLVHGPPLRSRRSIPTLSSVNAHVVNCPHESCTRSVSTTSRLYIASKIMRSSVSASNPDSPNATAAAPRRRRRVLPRKYRRH